MDAIIIDGSTGRFGAVAGVRHVRHPIGVARAVLEHTDHNMLAGAGATRFASEQGFDHVSAAELVGVRKSGPDHGTVGAVALDAQGFIAAATSTGGAYLKLPGRVGDSPLIGCGAMARPLCG
jgi:isoaspartyl peptidase/L-asparaginase-like protein (Ntn-hydrolase superfamily)